ncbi:MAG: hypothetical protein JO343_08885 [Candidatus Eremiobacteraeota bacterium]|nr:hypothetical protein [Candidatus Eremiobacteraeota bacterium]
MKLLLRAQMELFASLVQPAELISSERQKAIALLRALLMEAVVNQAGAPPDGGEQEFGNE